MLDYLAMTAIRGLSVTLAVALFALVGVWLFSKDAKEARRAWTVSVNASIEPRIVVDKAPAVKPWPPAVVIVSK